MENKDESKILGVSLRGWLALLIIFTVCFMSSTGTKVIEPLYSMSTMALGFFFGQKIANQKSNV